MTSAIIHIPLKMRTAKLLFLVLCSLLCVWLLTVLTLSSPAIKTLVPVRNCRDKFPSWLCDIGLNLNLRVKTPAPTQTSIPVYSSNNCPGLAVSFPLVEPHTFQRIIGSTTYIYSAFYDDKAIRIIGIRDKTDSSTFFCQFWSDSIVEDPLVVKTAHVSDLPEDHGKAYTPVYIICPVPRLFSTHPRIAVSVSKTRCGEPSAVVPVLRSAPISSEFIVCVPPLKYEYNDSHALVESIEFKRLLGARRLVFYNYSISETVTKILKHYVQHGVVDVHQWQLPVSGNGRHAPLHTAAQLAANNDCVYRNRLATRYLVILDVDEFIIPRGDRAYNWSQLVEKRLRETPKANTFVVRNVFFRKEWVGMTRKFVSNMDAVRYKSIVLQHITRETEIYKPNVRSKCIYNPRKVETVGIHRVWSTLQGDVDEVPAKDALVYHYRKLHTKRKIEKDRVTDTLVVDRYGLELLKRVKKAWKSIDEDVGLKFDEIPADCQYIVC